MSTSAIERRITPARATGVKIGEDAFTACLADGRRIAVPYDCFPRLEKADREQRGHFEVYAEGRMLHWPEIDEDIEVQHIVEGRMPVKLPRPKGRGFSVEPSVAMAILAKDGESRQIGLGGG